MNLEGFDTVVKECRDLGSKKNSDYSSGELDPISATGLNGIVIRLVDKVSRLNSLVLHNKDQKVMDESVRDTLRDITNYSIYGCMLIDGTWTVENEAKSQENQRIKLEEKAPTRSG